MKKPAAVDWEKVHGTQYVYENGCWTTCNGGFCCNVKHPDFSFRLIPQHGTTLLYMADEYRYFQKLGKVPTAQPQTISLPLGDSMTLDLVHVPCTLLGLCDGILSKPLLCRLYPFLPVLGTNFELESLSRATIFDLTFDAIQAPSPCTVKSKESFYFEKWQKSQSSLAPLRHPYIVLYLQAAKFFAENYLKELKKNDKLRGKSGKEFWRDWELEYLSGNLLNIEALTKSVKTIFDQLTGKYGSFYGI